VTVVGKKDDPAARSLFMAAIALQANYKRVEWWDEREGPMPNPDVHIQSSGKRPGSFARIAVAQRRFLIRRKSRHSQ
jgi:hypothetical protein